MLRCCSPLALVIAFGAIAPVAAAEKPELPLVYKDGFEEGADKWQPTDPSAWKILKTERGKVYSLVKRKSKYKPKHRSPHSIALLKDVKVGDFVLAVKIKSTRDTGNHRDACLFFNYQDPTHFYYVHFSASSDGLHNIIGLVNGADRAKINREPAGETEFRLTDREWHDFKVTYDAETAEIQAFLDDMATPIITASDSTLPHGLVGVGSFDDTGSFDDLKLFGEVVGH